ncbi:MAG: Transketolase, C-terminal section [Ignavibacteriae bacterium]|nr:MAG: Transketolase, C-terminal section [Ignavibacteriota bacterium]
MAKYKLKEMKATRLGFGEALVEIGHQNPNLVVIGADVTGSVRTDLFKNAFPERFFSVGIAEQDMIGTAAGLAVAGKIPVASTYGEFATGRPYDQIRQSVAYSKLNVKICASHCGITVGPDGATHQALEDIALMRVLPNMVVLSPSDYIETKKMIKAVINYNGPAYVRFFRDNTPVFNDENTPFEIGKSIQLIDGSDVTIIACGLQVWEAILAEEELSAQGVSVRVINMHTIKPIDKNAIIKAAKETGAIVTAEDHQIHGGLGSAVAEVLTQNYPVPQEFVAIKDKFGESGNGMELMKLYGISKDGIVDAVKKVLKRKLVEKMELKYEK